jgi:stage II sporulation protein AA (anti-sigma F factor antagonist)
MNGDDSVFDIATTQTDGVSMVSVTGEIDLANADAMQAVIARAATQTVVLDLTDVTFLDSSGIRAIDRARRGLLSEERSLLVVSPPGTPSAWTLRVAGFDRGLVVESVDAALTIGSPPAQRPS